MARVVNTSVLLDIHLDDPSFLFFLERNHLCHRLAPQRDDQRSAGGLNPFDQLDAPGFKLGNQYAFHSGTSPIIGPSQPDLV